jgi:hypothetical protein
MINVSHYNIMSEISYAVGDEGSALSQDTRWLNDDCSNTASLLKSAWFTELGMINQSQHISRVVTSIVSTVKPISLNIMNELKVGEPKTQHSD